MQFYYSRLSLHHVSLLLLLYLFSTIILNTLVTVDFFATRSHSPCCASHLSQAVTPALWPANTRRPRWLALDLRRRSPETEPFGHDWRRSETPDALSHFGSRKRDEREKRKAGKEEAETCRFYIMLCFVTNFKGYESQENVDQRKSMPNKNGFCLSE